MGTYIITADAYVNNVYIGKQKLRIPQYTFTDRDDGFSNYTQVMNKIEASSPTALCGEFFNHPLIAPMDNKSIFVNFGVSGTFNVFDYALSGATLDFVFGIRKIRITFFNVYNSDINKQFSVTYRYFLNDVQKCIVGNSYCGGWYDRSGFPSYFKENIQTIPWANPSKTNFGNYVIGCYQRYTSQYVQPTIQSSECNLTFWGTGSSTLNDFLEWIGDYEPEEIDDDNPYWDGGTSKEGGGDGNFSEDSDDIDDGDLAQLNAIDSGFATIFTPSKTQLKNLAGVMWNDNVFTALQNLVENISGMFTSLGIVPFEVNAGSTVEVTWFGLALTEIYLTLASEQYYEFDMGTIDMSNDSRIFTSGSALDYSPFSKLGIFLPFIGYQELDIDECRESTINLKYRIDILSGTCVALVSVSGNAIYQFSGNCLTQIPITNESMQSLVSDAVQVGIAAASTHAAKGAVGAAESALNEAESAGKSTKQAESQLAHAKAHLASTKSGLASATANASIGMKPTYGKTGAVSAAASLLSVRQPYLFLTTPRQSIPDHYQRFCGFPSNISGKLNTFSGFTVIEDIRLNGLVATSPEVAEIYDLLKRGVII